MRVRDLERKTSTGGCRGYHSVEYPEGGGRQEPHEEEDRAKIVVAILADQMASMAAKSQLENFYTEERRAENDKDVLKEITDRGWR